MHRQTNYTAFTLCSSVGNESACNAGDLDSIPGLGRSPGEGKGYPLQYSGLEKSKDCIMVVWGGLTNRYEKKRSEMQRRKGKI